MKNIGLALLLCFALSTLRAQYFTSGEDPARVKYSTIQTPHFKVIYPRNADVYAFRLASMLEQSYRNVQFSERYSTKKISVLVHTNSAISNGFVTWAPRRMELLSLPPFEFNAISWERDLAIHEFRHVSQISSLYSGLTGLSYYVLGEQGIGAMTSLVPLWFYEGDAVYAETAFTQSGRGRDSEFGLAYRTRLSNGEKLHFDTYLNGSFKQYIPNHYELGYLLTSYARVKSGKDIWDKVLQFTTSKPYLLAPFSFGIKKQMGVTREQLFNDAVSFHDSTWNYSLGNNKKNIEGKEITNYKKYADYSFPFLYNGCTYTFKTTLDKNTQVVRIKDGTEKVIKTVGLVSSDPFISNGILYWTEYAYAGRWSQVKFSVLRSMNLADNAASLLSDFGYYSYPAVRHDRIAIIKNLQVNTLELEITTLNFTRVASYPLPFLQVKNLQWVGDDVAYTTLDKHDNMLVVKHELKTGRIDTLMNLGRIAVKRAKVSGDTVTFISDFAGKNDLYEYRIASKSLRRIAKTNYSIGDYISLGTDRVIVRDYGIDGYRLKKLDRIGELVSNVSVDASYPVAAAISTIEGNLNLQDSTNFPGNYHVKKYRKGYNLFNFHSWAPFYFDPSEVQEMNVNIDPGVTLVSQNLLSTSFTTLAYGYKNGSHIFDISYTYKGWLPVLNLNVDRYGTLPKFYSVKGHSYSMDSTSRRTSVAFSTYMPFQFSYGAWNGIIQPYASMRHYNDIVFNSDKGGYEEGMDELSTSFYASWQMKTALQNIFPRWGVNFYFKSISAPFEKGNFGSLYAYRLGILTPGLFANHGLYVKLCYQNQLIDRYYFGSAFTLPRGYINSSFRSNYYKAIYTDYSFPIAYPDFNVSWLVYLKRIRANLFADFATNISMAYKVVNGTYYKIFPEDRYSSYGVDLLVDVNLLRSTFPITGGLRVAYNNDRTFTCSYLFTFSIN